jgi:hypothetical protein
MARPTNEDHDEPLGCNPGAAACALMVAFAFEANLNFMGNYLHKMGKIGSWEEKAKYYKKLDKVFDAIGIKVEKDKRPLSSMERSARRRARPAYPSPRISALEVLAISMGPLGCRMKSCNASGKKSAAYGASKSSPNAEPSNSPSLNSKTTETVISKAKLRKSGAKGNTKPRLSKSKRS